MSVFRPSARVVAPDGREWEIYAYRLELPRRRRGEVADDAALPGAGGELLGGLLDGVFWLAGGVLRLLEIVFLDAPRAAIRARRSDEWTIEAITWQPRRSSYTWRTTGEFRHNVVAQVEGQLASGEVPKPTRATYLGAS